LDEVLGLIALAGYILGIVGLAAGITYVVIKIFPTERTPKKDGDGTPAEPEKKQRASSEESAQGKAGQDKPAEGSLFRRSKREKRGG
jgi:hypothetical protein